MDIPRGRWVEAALVVLRGRSVAAVAGMLHAVGGSPRDPVAARPAPSAAPHADRPVHRVRFVADRPCSPGHPPGRFGADHRRRWVDRIRRLVPGHLRFAEVPRLRSVIAHPPTADERTAAPCVLRVRPPMEVTAHRHRVSLVRRVRGVRTLGARGLACRLRAARVIPRIRRCHRVGRRVRSVDPRTASIPARRVLRAQRGRPQEVPSATPDA